MKVTLLTNELPVMDFILDLDKKTIRNVNIINNTMANIYIPDAKTINYDRLEGILKYYMGGKYNMEIYIDHIKKNGFYTPYKRNLRIKIE